jgi:hypothetical protein
MPIYYYLGKDLQGKYSEPVFHQESSGVYRICRHLWEKFHDAEEVYAVVVNAQQVGVGQELAPDLVIISELGMTVIEMKDYAGEIDCGNRLGYWYYGNRRPMVDKDRSSQAGYANPGVQVRFYAETIRGHLTKSNPTAWLPWEQPLWKDIKIHTSVCFTNSLARLDHCKEQVKKIYLPDNPLRSWEIFSMITPAEVADLVFNMRYNVQTGPADFFRPLRLSPDEVRSLAERFFHGVQWKDLRLYLETDLVPYGYLELLDDKGLAVHRFALNQEDMLVGRGKACAIQISYDEVSRKHARLFRAGHEVMIEDGGSTHATYINGKTLTSRVPLVDGDVITLAPEALGEKCRLRYVSAQPVGNNEKTGTEATRKVASL